MSTPMSTLEGNLREGAEAREELVRFFSHAPAEQLLAALEGWNTAAPRGGFEVLDGLVVQPVPATRKGPVIELATGECLERSKISETGPWAFFTLRDNAEPAGSDFPYRATLTRRPGHGWLLVRIDSMCPSCFGAGIVGSEMRPCDACDASGWGNTEAEALRITGLA